MSRIAATRRARQRRMLLIASSFASVVVLVVAAAAWGLGSYVNAALKRVNAGVSGGVSGPLNIVVAGVDRRAGLTPHQQAELHVGHVPSSNSDTMMVAHISADRRRVTVVSLPRDSWVNIPGHGMGKINSAYGLGGPKLMVATVERNTGLTINDYIEVNFLGFIKVIDALGGVNVCLPYAVNDPYSGLRMSAGVHHVDGITALKYARDRHSFATSDLARIRNQQSLLASLLHEAIGSGTLANPFRLRQFVQGALEAVRVNQGLDAAALAAQLRGISTANVRFMTVPLANLNYLSPTGESAVLWDHRAAGRIFAAFKADRPLTRHPRHARAGGSAGAGAAPRPGQVRAKVYNGTLIGGLSAATGAELSKLGFQVRAGLTWPVHDISRTVIEYPPGQQPGARLLQRRALHGASLREVSGLSKIRVVLGTAGHAVTVPSQSGAGGSSGSGGGGGGGGGNPPGTRTAARAACH
jgi:LCP family protein required for cell wall assembly